MTILNLKDALNTSLSRTKLYIDKELAKKANSSHGTHVTYGGNGSATTVSRSDHTHSYVPLSTGSSITIHADSDSSSTSEYLLLKGGHNELKIASNAGGSTVTKSNTSLTFNGNVVYHAGNKPTPADIGAAASSHGTHLTLGTTSSTAYRGDYGNTAYTHSQAAHAPSNAQKNSDITKAEIEAKLTGAITTHTHAYAPTSHASTATTYGVSSASNYGHAMASGTTPKANGTAAVGSETAKFARGDHVHPLQTTVSGNAGTATKLATARKINGTSFDGSADITTTNWGTTRKINQVSVNGSADVKLPLDYYTCNIGSSNAKPYHHILTTGQCTGSYTDKSITIVLVNHYNSAGLGIAKATLRTNDAANGATASGELRWLVRSGFAEDQLCFNIRNTAKDAYMDVFYKATGTYNSLTWYVLTEGVRGSHSSQWTKYNTHHDNGTNVYNEAGMKAIRTYTATLQSAADHGAVNSAKTATTCSGNAATATKATKDSAGQQINTTYIKGLSVSGKTITYTKGDGTTGTITTQDTNTTYSAATQSAAGLMSAADKKKLDGVASGANAYVHPSYTAKSSGLYKITVNETGHVSAVTAVAKADITALGIPGSNTDTHYTAANIVGASATATANATASNGSVYLNLIENGAIRSKHKIAGSGATTVTSDSSGNITISSTNTTYGAATQSAAGLMSAADKKKLDGVATNANNYTYTLPSATSSVLGGVKIGSNITVSSGTISLTKSNVTAALGYTPPTTNTTYSIGTASTAGLTKLYTSTGTATDGTMTQSAIKSALDGKAGSSHGTHVSYGGNGSATTVSRSDHTHSYLPLSGGTVTGATTFNNYLKLNAWSGYGTGTADVWYDGTNKTVEIDGVTDLKLGETKVTKGAYTIWTGSQSAYNNISSKSSTTLYFIK